jgi:hypothetical protein
MTVAELIAALQQLPPATDVEMKYDIGDYDTTFEVYEVLLERIDDREVVIIKAR